MMLETALKKYWGYESFRPLQAEAMSCVLEDRDSLVVLPTGGGKSLCYQAPAVCRDGLAIVVSPLISLMKDQVDALQLCGVPAAFINSTQSAYERQGVADDIRTHRLRLLYIAPERLVQDKTIEFLQQVPLSFIAIDEAHCISEWGHDFRPEYRELRMLRSEFPTVALHGFTATATEHVRQDISEQLQLRNPAILVGSFDRPNLLYRTERRAGTMKQICEIINRHPRESGIIYCTTRRDVDEVSNLLNEQGYRSLPYHAGMDDVSRHRNQEAFINESIEIIVATVAFGMGIDKSNVRYVIHAGMPKALENYQQESGRAGRDGLQAECCLLYSMAEFMRWKSMIDEAAAANREAAMKTLQAMADYCTGVVCRHRQLVEYFGQEFPHGTCGACDVCLGELGLMDEPVVIGQKILSSIVRQGQRFGAEYTAQVLKGSREERIVSNGHDQLSTWGILSEHSVQAIRSWIDQLVSQGFLARVSEYNLLEVTAHGRELLKGELAPRLLRPVEGKERKKKRSEQVAASWDGVDRELFDELRSVRHDLAVAANLPAYIVFHDETLREMARYRPTNVSRLRQIRGIGEKRCADYGERFVAVIRDYARRTGKSVDQWPDSGDQVGAALTAAAGQPEVRGTKRQAFELFRERRSVAEVCAATQRAHSTVVGYLRDFLCDEAILDPMPWVTEMELQRIADAAKVHGLTKIKPLYEALHGELTYDTISIAVECLRNQANLKADAGEKLLETEVDS